MWKQDLITLNCNISCERHTEELIIFISHVQCIFTKCLAKFAKKLVIANFIFVFVYLFLFPDRELPRRRRLQRPRGRRVLRGRAHLRPRPRRRQGRPPRHRLDERGARARTPQPTSQNQPPTKQIPIQPFFPSLNIY